MAEPAIATDSRYAVVSELTDITVSSLGRAWLLRYSYPYSGLAIGENRDIERISVDLPKEWLSVADICGYMDVSTFVVTSQLRSGALPAVKFGREWRIARTDFEDWLNEQRAEADSKTRLPAPAAPLD